MAIGRNQACPCGSGRKYKHCCGRGGGGGASLRLPPEVVEEARRHREWEADVVALPVEVAGADDAWHAATLVCAGPVVVNVRQSVCRSAEPDRLAAMLEEALTGAAEAVGRWPETLFVRHPELAGALNERFEAGLGSLGRGERPEVESFFLDNLDDAARTLVEQLAGRPAWPPIAAVRTWGAWGLPTEQVGRLFAAAAAYHRAAPWEVLDDVPPLFASWPDDEWTLSVLGAAGEEYGLAVYADEADFDAMLRAESPETSLDDLRRWVLGLSFVERDFLPRPMQREVARQGWEVAAPDAYPLAMPMLTPGGGLPLDTVRRLTRALETVAELATTERTRLRRGEETSIEGPDGLAVLYPGEDPEDEGFVGRAVPPELEDVYDHLRSGRLESLEEAQTFVEGRVRAYNEAPHPGLSGLTPAQAQLLLNGGFQDDAPLQLADDLDLDDLAGADLVYNARTLLRAIPDDGIPATTAGNLKRAFVADMLDAMRWPEGEFDIIRAVNKVINEEDVPLLHVLRVVLEVGELLKRRKGKFHVTRRGRELTGDDAAGRLMAHLFRTWFRDFNIGYMGRGDDTAGLQYAVPLILARLPREAAEWVDRDELAERLLPPQPGRPAAADPPERRPGSIDPRDIQRIQLEVHVLRTLERFGLLQERRLGDGPLWRRPVEVRVTALFERFVKVGWEGG